MIGIRYFWRVSINTEYQKKKHSISIYYVTLNFFLHKYRSRLSLSFSSTLFLTLKFAAWAKSLPCGTNHICALFWPLFLSLSWLDDIRSENMAVVCEMNSNHYIDVVFSLLYVYVCVAKHFGIYTYTRTMNKDNSGHDSASKQSKIKKNLLQCWKSNRFQLILHTHSEGKACSLCYICGRLCKNTFSLKKIHSYIKRTFERKIKIIWQTTRSREL